MYVFMYICMYVCITLGLEGQSYEGEEIALKLFLNLAKYYSTMYVCMYVCMSCIRKCIIHTYVQYINAISAYVLLPLPHQHRRMKFLRVLVKVDLVPMDLTCMASALTWSKDSDFNSMAPFCSSNFLLKDQ